MKKKETVTLRNVTSGHELQKRQDTKMNWTIDRRSQYNLNLNLFFKRSCGGGLEYIHRSSASRKRRPKGNPVHGGITGPPCSWGI
jgi:hypothetical protein